jgi:hypothetical protein
MARLLRPTPVGATMQAPPMARSILRWLKSIALTSASCRLRGAIQPATGANTCLTRSWSVERCMFSPTTIQSWRSTRQPVKNCGSILPARRTTLITNRGINYWESADRSDRRLLFAAGNFLQEIDARTGKSILDFGESGRIAICEKVWDAILKVLRWFNRPLRDACLKIS